jgi:mono/diheme cytochrome c family protein
MRIDALASVIVLVAAALVLPRSTMADEPTRQAAVSNKADANPMEGWRTWRALACERCHGAQQEGLVGPSLVESLKRLSREDFEKTVTQGRIDKGMPQFGGSKLVVDNMDALYAYLKGRSEGTIQPGRPQS